MVCFISLYAVILIEQQLYLINLDEMLLKITHIFYESFEFECLHLLLLKESRVKDELNDRLFSNTLINFSRSIIRI